jgi:hypothetical protein
MAIDYTLSDQRIDGSFDYNGPPEKPLNFVDNYHTGFVLRMLASICHHSKMDKVRTALTKGLEYYVQNFFLDDGTPKLMANRIYRIDVHSAAESINCLLVCHSMGYDTLSLVEQILGWTMSNLYDTKNKKFFYAFQKSRFTGKVYRSEIDYLRWSQSWMLRALSRYLLYKEKKIVIL